MFWALRYRFAWVHGDSVFTVDRLLVIGKPLDSVGF